MKLAAQRFDGSIVIKDLPYVTDTSDLVLVPRRNAFTNEIVEFMRFDKTEQLHEGLPLFVQSDEALDYEDNEQETHHIIPQQKS